jgi:adenylate kinase
MKKKYQIIIMGPQSSGKGTQAELLAKKLKLPIISVGNTLRSNIRRKTKVGKVAEQYVKRGVLAPDNVINQIIKEKIQKQKKGFILDGYPRDIEQAKFLGGITEITHVFEITLSDKIAIERIKGRRNCLCGQIYHIKYRPPKKAGVCDKDGQKLFIRKDDRISAIKKRLKIYRRETRAVLPFYKKEKVLYKIDGRPEINKVYQQILKKL